MERREGKQKRRGQLQDWFSIRNFLQETRTHRANCVCVSLGRLSFIFLAKYNELRRGRGVCSLQPRSRGAKVCTGRQSCPIRKTSHPGQSAWEGRQFGGAFPLLPASKAATVPSSTSAGALTSPSLSSSLTRLFSLFSIKNHTPTPPERRSLLSSPSHKPHHHTPGPMFPFYRR